ncbi:MAG: hypothetical protein WCI95_12050 [bacterium]
MSLCHIWFGVLRSKKRGLEGLRGGLFFTTGISAFACSVRLTVSALAGTKNIRLSNCEIRLTPKSGFAFFTSTIFACSPVNFPFRFRRHTGSYLVCNPASPCSRYRFTQANNVLALIPISFATKGEEIPSSKYNFTALRRFSNEIYPE